MQHGPSEATLERSRRGAYPVSGGAALDDKANPNERNEVRGGETGTGDDRPPRRRPSVTKPEEAAVTRTPEGAGASSADGPPACSFEETRHGFLGQSDQVCDMDTLCQV